MIMSAKCRGIQELTLSVLVELECGNGWVISARIPKEQECPFQFQKEYVLEFNTSVAGTPRMALISSKIHS